ncbi:MAG: 3-dehydroquinate synthase [Planctomycetes bacterium]|nr:3-dehydroquinate synthase [Planctomycetota bacterium]
MTLNPVFGLGMVAKRLPKLIRQLETPPTRVVAVLDRGAKAAMHDSLLAGLHMLNVEFKILTWSPSEKRKSLAELEKLTQRMIGAGLDRGGLLIGVGGGITTDMTGFAAAIYMRGVRWAALPTTLLGMADAAIGGKTAVNLPQGKNLLGAFHMPQFVLADVASLSTLAERDWSCGMGEVVKSGMIGSPSLLRRLEKASRPQLRSCGADMLAIARATAKVKCTIVEEDPLEHGRRKLLNLGHTFGHAMETAAGPRRLAHGEAVALGLQCALDMAVDQGLAKATYRQRMLELFEHCGLPVKYPGKLPTTAELTRLIGRDKKKAKSSVDVILPLQAGECVIVPGQAPRDLALQIQRSFG